MTKLSEFCSVHAFDVGVITLKSNSFAITGLYFGAHEPTAAVPDLHYRAAAELEQYFAGSLRDFTVPIKLHGTPFQLAVWQELLKIPYGETRSYKDIACAIGKPKATRAVGGANHNNPISIIVPCHRVIASDGTLGGYGGGLDIKRRLLELEKRSAAV